VGHHVHPPAVLGQVPRVRDVTMSALTAEIGVGATTPRELSASFGSELVTPGDPIYEEHRRVWNGSIDRFPALIARCSGGPDVIAAVRFARSTGLPLAARGERFSVATAEGGAVRALLHRVADTPLPIGSAHPRASAL
jgi:hypothetical protein